MRTRYILMALIFLPTFLFSQNVNKTPPSILQIETGFASPKFYVDNERASKQIFSERIAINPEANQYFKKGNRLFITESVFSFIGSVIIVKGVAPIVLNAPLNFKSIGVGAGFMGIALLIHSFTNKAFTKSVDIYTDDSLGTVQKVKLGLGVGGDGVGLVVRF